VQILQSTYYTKLDELTLLNQRLFVLNDEQWQAFQAALDAPPQEKPRLRRLLTEPSVFE
jgi:uncharacterized protein (DUF1778 family)